MALFKKRENSKIPPIPSLPEFGDSHMDKGLPSLPGNMNEDINRNIIKSAINDEPNEYPEHPDNQGPIEGTIPSLPKEYSESVDSGHERFLPAKGSPTKLTELPKVHETKPLLEGPDSIFVRIDKFKSAKKCWLTLRTI